MTLAILFFLSSLISLNDSDFQATVIQGVVKDEITNENIPYAYI